MRPITARPRCAQFCDVLVVLVLLICLHARPEFPAGFTVVKNSTLASQEVGYTLQQQRVVLLQLFDMETLKRSTEVSLWTNAQGPL